MVRTSRAGNQTLLLPF